MGRLGQHRADLRASGVLTLTVVLVFGAATAHVAQAQTFNVLYNFTTWQDGSSPLAGLIQDKSGNLYGSTAYGGSYDGGVVFELNSAGGESVLYSFGEQAGLYPYAPVIRDSKGDIYGTTKQGGNGDCAYGCGTVFKLDTSGNEKVLHSFPGGTSDGCEPEQGVVLDRSGNIYGTTNECGASGYGIIFKLTRKGKETILHNFAGGSADGAYPAYGHLIMDRAGDLYGVTVKGGASDCGVVYKLTKNGVLTVLHSFAGDSSDGGYPQGTVAMDKAGNLYGTASAFGLGGGVVWRAGVKGKETILHKFAGGSADGCWPYAGVVRDSRGNLYGNTEGCGAYGYGTVWKLSAKGALTLLKSFGGSDGAYPYGELLRTTKGELFGTTSGGGTGGSGTVWEYVP